MDPLTVIETRNSYHYCCPCWVLAPLPFTYWAETASSGLLGFAGQIEASTAAGATGPSITNMTNINQMNGVVFSAISQQLCCEVSAISESITFFAV